MRAPVSPGGAAGDDAAAARARNLHQWGAVTLFHGLPSDRVRAIAQDADGVMWFGTDAGLARNDGRRTQTVTSEGLPPGRVLALKVDEDGVLWVGTEGGATRLLKGEFHRIQEIAGKAITAIITPERGRVVLASQQGLVFDCAVRADDELEIRTIPHQPLTSADVDKPGALQLTSLALAGHLLYVGTRSRGLLTIQGNEVHEVQSRPRAYFVETLEQDGEGRVWFGAKARPEDSGLYQAGDPAHPVKIGAGLGTTTALRRGPQGDLWVGTDGRGVFHYKDAKLLERFTFEGTAGGLRSDYIYSIFVDRERVVWFGTDRGVCRYDTDGLRNEAISPDRQSNFVRALFRTRDGKLLSGTNNGLFIYEEAANSWREVQEFSGKAIYAITEDTAGRLLVGSSQGLYQDVQLNRPVVMAEQTPESESADAEPREQSPPAEKETETAVPVESVRAITTFQGTTYIAIYGRGVARLEGNGRTLVWPGADQTDARLREVTSLHADGDNRLWIGTAHASVYAFDGRRVEEVHALEALQTRAVWAIDGTSERGLWIATSNGLYVYRSGELKEFAAATDVRSVVADAEQGSAPAAWCATSGGGLLRVLEDRALGLLVSRLDVEQGLPSQNAFAILRTRSASGDETLLIGTTRGVVRYTPGHVTPVLRATRILSQHLHEPEELKTGIRLDYPQNSLALDTAALSSRTYPEEFQYAFLLRDSTGREIKRKLSHDSQFLMENLRPGLYRVEARAFTKDLVASEPLSFEFSVGRAPFPWTIAALSALLVLALAALVWAVVEHRKIARTGAALERANRKLAGARLELANEAERERRRIARDLHDQTLADLRSLLLLTDQLPAEANGNGHGEQVDPQVFRTEIESVSNEIRRICEDLSPSVLDNVGLAAALEWALANAVAHLPAQKKFIYEFVSDDEAIEERAELAPGVRIQIYRIAQEVINNICRHAEARHVRLTVTLATGGDLLLTIEDDGRYFEPKARKAKRGRGLSNIRARASLIEAEVSWGKRAGGGTRFTLRKAHVAKEKPVQITAD